MNTCEQNLNRLKRELDQTDWSEVYYENEANRCYKKFIEKFECTYKKCVPVPKYTVKEDTKLNG